MDSSYDIIIIGTGAGGGTLAYALRNSGANILLLERGDYLPREDQNWDANSVFTQARYKSPESWEDVDGPAFKPGVHYFVGGNTKVYGAALPRARREDFEALEHGEGTSPAWPISYDELEPYYLQAEEIYRVHARAGEDPNEPERSGPFPFPNLEHEPIIQALHNSFQSQGLHPFHLPIGVDVREGGSCIWCSTCDGFPCKVGAKSDAEVCCVTPALESPDVTLKTHTHAHRLLLSEDGRKITGVEVESRGEQHILRAETYVVACGAVNSAALLLQSGDSEEGIANKTGLVGRNYMAHNNTALIALHPFKKNPTVFQKTLALNDFYFDGPNWNYPMGNLQLIGQVQGIMLKSARPAVPLPLLNALASRTLDWWVMSEDLPDPDNRITLTPAGSIRIRRKMNNQEAHRRLLKVTAEILKEAGYPFVFSEPMGIETNSHQCGTIRFGEDGATSVLDPYCKAHDLDNLYVVDASFFPSSTAVNPALTIAAQALRVGEHLIQTA